MKKKTEKFDDMDEPLPLTHPVHDRPTHPINPARITAGEIVSMTIYGRVQEVNPDGTLVLEDLLHDGTYTLPIMVANMKSADQWSEEKTISRTVMEQIFLSIREQPLTVAYVKKDGQERILRGYRDLDHPVQKLGRILCDDLTLPKEKRLRLVDPRSFVWMITGGVRYVLHKH